MSIKTFVYAAIAATALAAVAAPASADGDRRSRIERGATFERGHGGHVESRPRVRHAMPAVRHHAKPRHQTRRHVVRHYRGHRPYRRPATVHHYYKPDYTPLYALGAVSAFVGLHSILTTPSYDPPPAPAYAVPAAAAQAPVPAQPVATTEPYCREYTRQVTVNGTPAEAYGKACRQPDGSWRIVSEN